MALPLPSEVVAEVAGGSDEIAKGRLRRRLWKAMGRAEQQLPEGDWWLFLLRGGRGSGKTRGGAEGLADLIVDNWDGEGDWAVVAPTFADARDVCIEGDSGLLRALAGFYEPGSWNRTMGQLVLKNGATVFTDGANDGALRIQGKNLRGAWCDEVGLWRQGRQGRASDRGRQWWEIAWDESLAFAIRIDPAKIIATGTPKRGHPLVKRLLDDPTVVSRRLRTVDNIKNLSARAIDRLVNKFRGTALEKQELEGEFIDQPEGALWTLDLISEYRWKMEWGQAPNYNLVYVGVDPSGSSSESAGETGIVASGQVAGRCPCGYNTDQAHYAVISDFSLRGEAKARAQAIASCFRATQANKVIGERNYGGDMVAELVRQVGGDRIPYEDVNATRGKDVRAEPIVLLYQQGRVHHMETFDLLEDQMAGWTRDSGWSPDRLDALVWGLHKLSERPSNDEGSIRRPGSRASR